MQDKCLTVTQLMDIVSTGKDACDPKNPPVIFYEYDDDEDDLMEPKWTDDLVLFSIGVSAYDATKFLKPKYANAIVERIFARKGEPLRVMITPKEGEKND